MNKSGVTSVALFKLAQCPPDAILSLSLAATTAVSPAMSSSTALGIRRSR